MSDNHRQYVTAGYRAGDKMPHCYGHFYFEKSRFCGMCAVSQTCKAVQVKAPICLKCNTALYDLETCPKCGYNYYLDGE